MRTPFRRTIALAALSTAGLTLATGQAAATAPVYTVAYNGKVLTTSAHLSSGDGGLLPVSADTYANVTISVNADSVGSVFITGTASEFLLPHYALPPGVAVTVAGEGCRFSTPNGAHDSDYYDCPVTPGTNTFTATVLIGSASSLAKSGGTVQLISYLLFAGEGEGPWHPGGYVHLGLRPAPTSPTPSTSTAPRPQATPSTARPAPAQATTAPARPQPSASPAAPPMSTSGTQSPPAPATPSGPDTTTSASVTPTPTSIPTSATSANPVPAAPVAHSDSTRAPATIGLAAAAAVAVVASGAFGIIRRRRHTSRKIQ